LNLISSDFGELNLTISLRNEVEFNSIASNQAITYQYVFFVNHSYRAPTVSAVGAFLCIGSFNRWLYFTFGR
jgi:hypothetical protein